MFLKNCLGNAFLQENSFEAGSECHLKKRKEKRIPTSVVEEYLFDMEVEKRLMRHLCGLCHKTLVFP